MADYNRVFKNGALVDKLAIGEQGVAHTNYATIEYDKLNDVLNINANLNVYGNLTQLAVHEVQVEDKVITLNKMANGQTNPDQSGIEVARAGNYATLRYVEATQAWTATWSDGTPMRVKTSFVPTAGDDLTNKTYVDNAIAGTAGSLTLAGSLGDVVISSPSEGQILKYVSGKWRNSTSTGVTSIAVNSPGSSISVSGSPITTSGTISLDLPTQSITAGTYRNSIVTVNSKGIITNISDNSMFQTFRVNATSGGSSNNTTAVPVVWNDYLILTAGQGLDLSGYDPDSGPGAGITFSIRNSGVAPGSYSSANITVDATGRITSASNGSAGLSINVPSGTDISNKSSISMTSSGGTIAINGTSATNINYDLPVRHGGGTNQYATYSVNQHGIITGISPFTPPGAFGRVTANSGYVDAGFTPDTLQVIGKPGSGVTTEMSGHTLYINSSGAFQSAPTFSGNGYARFNGDLMIQWGRYQSGSGGIKTVYWNTSWPNAVLSVAIGSTMNPNNDSVDDVAGVYYVASSYWQLRTRGNLGIYWIAVGF
ncbi:MAG: hypothetical protein M0R77_16945 [Gammaproteobacteria bacterium]|nr:hypothetical protein [Gammaproteobacteria bacterium]